MSSISKDLEEANANSAASLLVLGAIAGAAAGSNVGDTASSTADSLDMAPADAVLLLAGAGEQSPTAAHAEEMERQKATFTADMAAVVRSVA